MAKYSDFQINSMTRSSLSQGICLEPDGHSFTGQSSSETSLADDEGIDDSVSLYNEGNDQITIKVCGLFVNRRRTRCQTLVHHQRNSRFTRVNTG